MSIAEEIHDSLLDCNNELPWTPELIRKILNKRLYSLLCEADGLLSAVRHGRNVPDRDLENVYYPLRKICEEIAH